MWYNTRMKNKYEVRIPEVHYSYRFVEAENAEAAKHIALFGSEDYEEYMEYSHTLEENIEVIQLKGDN